MKGIDTNILVYAFDSAYKYKNEICKKIIMDIFQGKGKGVVTNQILAEFSLIATKKIEKPLEIKDIKSIIGTIMSSENWKIFNYNSDTILKSLDNKNPFWDSLIIQTFKDNNINEIITENVKDFQDSGLIIINPFGK